METRQERRKQAKQARKQKREDGKSAAALRHKLAVAAGALAAVGLAAGAAGYAWKMREGRGPASAAGGVDQEKGMTFEQAQEQLRKKNEMFQKSKEWAWAEEGRTDLVIEAYRGLSESPTARPREERQRLLTVLARTVRPRAQWPKGFDDRKAREVLSFLEEVMRKPAQAGPDSLVAMTAMMAYAQKVPEYLGRVEKALLALYRHDDRPGPSQGVLNALSKLKSRKAIPLLLAESRSKDHSMARTAVYSLANYLDTPLAKEPRDGILWVARNNDDLRPLAVKLLANAGDRRVASLVPRLLHERSDPAQVEAAAFAIEKLHLAQYRALLERFGRAGSSFVQERVDSAAKSVGPHAPPPSPPRAPSSETR